jgi:L-amino acid N-acyltransferase YncA
MNIIRIAKTSDAASILEIYTPYILNTAITFETEIPSLENIEYRIITYQESWPWLVYEIAGTIVGYAYATKHRERAAYQWCVESSVYISDNFQQKGIAQALYTALFEILKYQGCRNVYAGITLPNDKSISFHKKFGFSKIAEYKKIGYKLGLWNTVSWWELKVNEYSADPAPPMKFSDIDNKVLEKCLQYIS